MKSNNSLDTTIERLVELMDLEVIEENIFRGESQDIGSPQVFGGQVLGQALMWLLQEPSRVDRFTLCMLIF